MDVLHGAFGWISSQRPVRSTLVFRKRLDSLASPNRAFRKVATLVEEYWHAPGSVDDIAGARPPEGRALASRRSSDIVLRKLGLQLALGEPEWPGMDRQYPAAEIVDPLLVRAEQPIEVCDPP